MKNVAPATAIAGRSPATNGTLPGPPTPATVRTRLAAASEIAYWPMLNPTRHNGLRETASSTTDAIDGAPPRGPRPARGGGAGAGAVAPPPPPQRLARDGVLDDRRDRLRRDGRPEARQQQQRERERRADGQLLVLAAPRDLQRQQLAQQ